MGADVTQPAEVGGSGPRAWIAAHVTLALFLVLRYGHLGPRSNEWVYAVPPLRIAHPDVLANDLTFGGAPLLHFGFNFLVAPLFLVLEPELAVTVARMALIVMVSSAGLLLARSIGCRALAASLAIVLYCLSRQSLFGGEWIFASFEGKTVAYALVLASGASAMAGRRATTVALAAAATLCHPIVGLWHAAALGGAWVVVRAREAGPRGFVQASRLVAIGAVLQLVAIAPMLVAAASASDASRELLRELVLVRNPHHLDPFAILSPWRIAAAVVLVATFVLLARRVLSRPQYTAWTAYVCTMWLAVVGGAAARAAELWQVLLVYPLRLAPVITPLACLLMAAAVASRGGARARYAIASVAAVVVLVALRGFQDDSLRSALALASWRDGTAVRVEETDWTAYEFLRHRSGVSVVVIAPPWHTSVWLRGRRASVAGLKATPPGELGEWSRRIDALLGSGGYRGPHATAVGVEHYERLSPEALRTLHERTSAEYYVTTIPRPDLRESLVFSGGSTWLYRIAD